MNLFVKFNLFWNWQTFKLKMKNFPLTSNQKPKVLFHCCWYFRRIRVSRVSPNDGSISLEQTDDVSAARGRERSRKDFIINYQFIQFNPRRPKTIWRLLGILQTGEEEDDSVSSREEIQKQDWKLFRGWSRGSKKVLIFLL